MTDLGERLHRVGPGHIFARTSGIFPEPDQTPWPGLPGRQLPDWVTGINVPLLTEHSWRHIEYDDFLGYPHTIPVCTSALCPNEYPGDIAVHFVEESVFPIYRGHLDLLTSYSLVMQHILDHHEEALGRSKGILAPVGDVLILFRRDSGRDMHIAKLSKLLKKHRNLREMVLQAYEE